MEDIEVKEQYEPISRQIPLPPLEHHRALGSCPSSSDSLTIRLLHNSRKPHRGCYLL